MPYCFECQHDMEVTARCAGSNCRAGICPLCFEGDGLCSECRAEQAKGIWQRRAAEKRCPISGEPADQCEHLIGTEESDHAS